MSSLFGHVWSRTWLPGTPRMEGPDRWLPSKRSTDISGRSLTPVQRRAGVLAWLLGNPCLPKGEFSCVTNCPAHEQAWLLQRGSTWSAITEGKAKRGQRGSSIRTPRPLSWLGLGLASTCFVPAVSCLKILSSSVYCQWSGYHCDSPNSQCMGLYICA